MNTRSHRTRGSAVGWLALVVAVAALVVAVIAVNRTGTDLEAVTAQVADQVADQVAGATESLRSDLDETRREAAEQAQRVEDTIGALARDARDDVDTAADPLAAPAGAAELRARLDEARAAAAERLAEIELADESQQAIADARAALLRTRDDLAAAYDDLAEGEAGEEARARWEALRPEFERAADALREGTADGVGAFRDALRDLERDLRDGE